MLVSSPPETSKETKEKLAELILYISDRCETDENYGMVKLNKIILEADRLAYLRFGKSITETPYMRLQNGLVPYHMIRVLEEMKAEGDIVIREKQHYQYVQKRVVALRNPKLKSFSADDIALVEETIKECSSYDATTMSDRSHGTAWKVAGDRQQVPYEAFLLSDNQAVSESDIIQAHELIERHGWDVKINA
jgi:hypothetical protein